MDLKPRSIGLIENRSGINSEKNAEYLVALVIKALVQEGFEYKDDKRRKEYSKGTFKVRKWGSIGYSIMLTFKW